MQSNNTVSYRKSVWPLYLHSGNIYLGDHLSYWQIMHHCSGCPCKKMEGLLCWWALTMQEFDFVIRYCKDCHNGNVDALSPPTSSPPVVAATQFTTNGFKEDIQEAQQGDPTLQSVYEAIQKLKCRSNSPQWHKFPLARYCKLWPQLLLHCVTVFCVDDTPHNLVELK